MRKRDRERYRQREREKEREREMEEKAWRTNRLKNVLRKEAPCRVIKWLVN